MWVLALDVGTCSARAVAYDATARPVAGLNASVAYEPVFTADGGAELDADRLLEAVAGTIDRCLAAAREPPAALGASIFWHGHRGRPRALAGLGPHRGRCPGPATGDLLAGGGFEPWSRAPGHRALGAPEPPALSPGRLVVPDMGRHAVYRAAMRRQRDLYDIIVGPRLSQ